MVPGPERSTRVFVWLLHTVPVVRYSPPAAACASNDAAVTRSGSSDSHMQYLVSRGAQVT